MTNQTVPAKTAHILVNPAARGAHRFDPGAALDLLSANDWEAEIHVGEDEDHFTELAATAAKAEVDLLFVVGGDGAVRIAAGAVVGRRTAVAVIPAGTANVWAKEIGISSKPLTAMAQHLGGYVRAIDIGRANGEPFVLMASLGWDAQVVQQVSPGTKRRFGELAYAARALTALPGLRTLSVAWESDGVRRTDNLALLVASNTSLYGGRVRFSPQAKADDGLLEVCALAPRNLRDVVRLGGLLARGQLAGHAGVITSSAHQLSIETKGIPYQLDGDLAGVTPVAFSVEPGALFVSLPPGPLPGIFAGLGAVTK